MKTLTNDVPAIPDTEKLFLCRPCAEALKNYKTVKRVKIGAHHKEKRTCDQCCCRRFGYDCEVEYKPVSELEPPAKLKL